MHVLARAKINVFLHVTGRRADGYHALQSLVVFADVGDVVHAAPASALSLALAGPYARALPEGEENLVLRAARALAAGRGAALTLEKHLPVAAGMGGGSADAAAALNALSALWQVPVPPDLPAALGSDVPVCMLSQAAFMEGRGEVVRPVHAPPLHAVLVNPGVPVSTREVFARLSPPYRAPLVLPEAWDAAWLLSHTHNDLEPAAIALCPVIENVLAALRAERGCALARMSGSGATCVGLFLDAATATAAAEALQFQHPGWWCVSTVLG